MPTPHQAGAIPWTLNRKKDIDMAIDDMLLWLDVETTGLDQDEEAQ